MPYEKRNISDKFIEASKGRKTAGYAPEFERSLTKENIGAFLKIDREFNSPSSLGTMKVSGNMAVEIVGIKESEAEEDLSPHYRRQLHEGDRVLYYKVSIPGQTLFVKKAPSYYHSGGYHEGLSTHNAQVKLEQAQEKLQKLGIDAEVIQYKLGYTDAAKGVSYYISEWNQPAKLRNFGTYASSIELKWKEANQDDRIDEDLEREYERVEGIKYAFQDVLGDYFDVEFNNIAQDDQTGKFYLFDLNEWDLKHE